jgi:hypothetical protein
MRKNRLTRLSFKRKAVTFGATVFTSVALGATGFAAWVMSTNAEKDVTGNVNVGLVEGGALSFSDVVISSESKGFYFEPKVEDTTGRVKYKEGGMGESMEITVTGNISPLQELGKLYYKVQVPQGVKDAAEAGYIVLPEGSTLNAKATSGVDFVEGVAIPYRGASGTFQFTFDVEFTWGDVFGGENPGIYYDSEAGQEVSHVEVRKTLEDFRAIIYGYSEDLQAIENNSEYSDEKKAEERAKLIEEHANDVMPQFIVVVYAESKL